MTNVTRELIDIANYLDKLGLTKEADFLDALVGKANGTPLIKEALAPLVIGGVEVAGWIWASIAAVGTAGTVGGIIAHEYSQEKLQNQLEEWGGKESLGPDGNLEHFLNWLVKQDVNASNAFVDEPEESPPHIKRDLKIRFRGYYWQNYKKETLMSEDKVQEIFEQVGIDPLVFDDDDVIAEAMNNLLRWKRSEITAAEKMREATKIELEDQAQAFVSKNPEYKKQIREQLSLMYSKLDGARTPEDIRSVLNEFQTAAKAEIDAAKKKKQEGTKSNPLNIPTENITAPAPVTTPEAQTAPSEEWESVDPYK